MKRILNAAVLGLASMSLLSGCIGLQLGGGPPPKAQSPTLGQQLIDLQHAKAAGAINESEYQAQKAKLLGQK